MTGHPTSSRRSRRALLRDVGRTSFGLLIVGAGLSGCDQGGDPVVDSSPTTDAAPPTTGSAAATETGGEAADDAAVSRALVDLGFVAAYVVSRAGQAAVIDTGVDGSEGDIEMVLAALGLGWDAVSDIIVTHAHGDHAGSLAAVSAAAAEAAIWAGAGDIDQMTAARDIAAVGDGDQVFGMDIIETPGHTPGHISVLDAGVLFTGDALVGGDDGRLAGPPEQFTADLQTAIDSVAKLAAQDVTEVNVFHGFPVEATGADLTALAEQLGQ